MTQQINGLQNMLDAALSGRYDNWYGKGYRLKEDGDHFLILHHRGRRVAVFTQGAPIREIYEECRRDFEKVRRCPHVPGATCNVPDGICKQINCQARISR